MFYICDPCKITTIPSDQEGNSKRKRRAKSTSQTQNTHQDADAEIENTTLTMNEEGIVPMGINGTNDEVMPQMQGANTEERSVKETKNYLNDQQKDSGNSNRICRFYKNGNCKHGLKGKECKYLHPKMCRKFTQHGSNKQRGCNLGKKCNDFHPKMCFDSLRKGECLNKSCRFAHVKGTKRDPTIVKNTVTHDNKLLRDAKDVEIRNPVPNHFLETMRLMKEEIMETLNKKITSIENHLHHLQQTQTNQIIPQFPMPTLPMARPTLPIRQQTNLNPIQFQ